MTFEMNDFKKPKVKSEIETIKDAVLYLLYSKPGDYPSLPTLGLDIHKWLYSFYDELDVDTMCNNLIAQCSALGAYVSNGTIQMKKMVYRGQPTLLIYISGTISYDTSSMYFATGETSSSYAIGLTLDNEDVGNLISHVTVV